MKLKFTIPGLLFLFFFSNNVFGQEPNTIEIFSPAEIAGQYQFVLADGWGGQLGISTGTGIFINDGTSPETDACEDSVAPLGGNWGLADRGECNFSLKALNIQNAGGAVAIICNNNPGEGLIDMAPGDVADQVTIPTLMLSYEDCQTIRSIGEDVEFSIGARFECGARSFTSNYVWGTNPGEGDFDGGLGDWRIENENDNGWLFEQFTRDFGGTNCNGYVRFPTGDYFFDERDGGCPPLGNAGAGLLGACNGRLISPTIQLDPSQIENLVIEYTSLYAYWFSGATSIVVSYDEGITWPDTIVAHAAADGNGFEGYPTGGDGCDVETTVNSFLFLEENNRLPILGYDGQESITLQFFHIGHLFDVTIDDVALLSLPDFHDIRLGQQFVSYAPAFAMPESQAQEIPLHVDVVNKGTNAVDVEITANAFFDGGTDPVWTAVNDSYGTQPANCFLNQNLSFDEFYIPEGIGSHIVTMENTTPDEGNADGEDIVAFQFFLTEETWATPPPDRDFITDNFFIRDPMQGQFIGFNYGMAYPFYIPNGDGHFLNQVNFGLNVGGNLTGNAAVYVYRWEPSEFSFPAGPRGAAPDEDANPGNFIIAPEDTEVVGVMVDFFLNPSADIPINPSFGLDYSNIPVRFAAANRVNGAAETNADGEFISLELEDDAMYILVIGFNPTAQDTEADWLSLLGSRSLLPDPFYQVASEFAYANNGLYRRSQPMIFALDGEGIGFDAINSAPIDIQWAAGTPWLEMEISETPVFSTDTEDLSPEVAAGVDIYPNPVSDNLTVTVKLNELSSTVSFELVNVNGELVKTVIENDVQRGEYTIPVGDLTPGVYTLNVRTEAGFTAEKVVVQR